MKFYLYAIKSKTNGRIYIGQTQNLKARLQKHNYGKVISTKRDRPWMLYAYEIFDNRSSAMWKEKEIKNSKGNRLKWLENNMLNEPTPRREVQKQSIYGLPRSG